MQRELALIGNVIRELELHPANEIAACKSLSDSIYRAMRHAGMSQESLAAKVSVTPSYLSLILADKRNCPAKLVLEIVSATKSAAPLQWMNAQVGATVYLDPVDVRKAQLRRELDALEARAA
jgi:transcriptional regulator with XRE-family HTH domain